ncbi:MAG: DUF819 family protein [Bacteroidota bacterium]
MEKEVLFTNDAIVLGILMVILAFVMITSSSKKKSWQRFYRYFPPVLACYFFPAIFNSLEIISGETSQLYFVASRYLLPACLVLLCISIDLKGIINLGPKAIIMFFAATAGIVIGGPVALFIVSLISPELAGGIGPDAVWRGLATVAGSWIGGGANQTAMKEIYGASENLFASMILVDVIVANIWLGFLLYGVTISGKIDKWLNADNTAIDDLRKKVENYSASVARNPSLNDTLLVLAVGFGTTAIAHWLSGIITPFMEIYTETLNDLNLTSLLSGFFWLVVIATTLGLILSFTSFKKLEGVGASRFGSVFIYVLVATIGMKMNIGEILNNLGLFAIGIIWMLIHIAVLLITAKLIKAPFFFVAVGSQANVGGAASAPVVAAAFSPALAAVGVLMAVLGYALGTYGAIICAQLMQAVSP